MAGESRIEPEAPGDCTHHSCIGWEKVMRFSKADPGLLPVGENRGATRWVLGVMLVMLLADCSTAPAPTAVPAVHTLPAPGPTVTLT